MAASSTDAFISGSGSIGCFNGGLLKPAQEKFWGAEVMATASTESFWEDDPEEQVKKKINELKSKFHSGRQLQVKHLPRDVTEEEIRDLLSDFPVVSVQLQCGSGTGAGLARASLDDPEMLEDWDRDRIFTLRGQRVPVAPTPTDMLLCVARLPLSFTEHQFAALVSTYGEVRRCFLMISEKTGESKGYGFVEYTTKETALHAKNLLDKKIVEDWVLCCDWLDASHVTFESLHSKCLYVDRLPKDFRDMGQFRKVFSSIVSPPYCQIALKNGCPQDWGLVEYSSSEDAEAAQTSLNGYNLCGQRIRISYYMPGVRAINLYLKLLNESNSKKAAGLLPDPTAPAIFQQLQTLAKQNPVFAQNLQNIIMTQIQSLSAEGKQRLSPTPPLGPSPPLSKSSSPNGLVNDPQIQQLKNQLTSNHPLLMTNPQMLSTLQNLLKQQNSAVPTTAQASTRANGQNGLPSPNDSTLNGYGKQNHNQKNGFLKPNQPQKIPLLPNPGCAPASGPGAASGGASGRSVQLSSPPPLTSPIPPPVNVNVPVNVPVSVSLSPSPSEGAGLTAWPAGMLRPHPTSPLLMAPLGGDASGLPFAGGPNAAAAAAAAAVAAANGLQMPGSDLQTTINSILNNQQNLRQLMATLSSAIQNNGAGGPSPPNVPPAPAFSFVPRPPPTPTGMPPEPWATSQARSIMTSPLQVQPPKHMGFLDLKPPTPTPMFNSWGGGFMSSPVPPVFSPYQGALVPGLWSPNPSPGPPPTLLTTAPNGMLTPIGHKRKYNHILPSPEPSPEGNYIGQHSQGLGGHYADSYFKRKKKN